MRSRHFDAQAMAAAIERPGSDPRVWLALAVVRDVGIDDEGSFADLWLLPAGPEVTAMVGSPYAGAGFGMHARVKVDDTVMVALPMGAAGNGPVIVSRYWSASDPPPPEAMSGEDPSPELVLRVEPGQTLRIIVDGEGEAIIEARGTGKVRLGAAAATQAVALDPLVRSAISAAVVGHTHSGVTTGSGVSGTGTITLPNGVPSTAASKVEGA